MLCAEQASKIAVSITARRLAELEEAEKRAVAALDFDEAEQVSLEIKRLQDIEEKLTALEAK